MRTKIEWCDSTVTPVVGGSHRPRVPNHFLPEQNLKLPCQPFWNELTREELTREELTREGLTPGAVARAAAWPELSGQRRQIKSWLSGNPRLILIADVADSFDEEVPFEYLRKEVISQVTSDSGERHVWLWLTVFPSRMAEFSEWLLQQNIEWPVNLWAGASLDYFQNFQLVDLARVGNANTKRFVHLPPQSRRIHFGEQLRNIHWLIQSGPTKGCREWFSPTWHRALEAECHQYGVAYFQQTYRLPMLENNPFDPDGDGIESKRHYAVLFGSHEIPQVNPIRRAGSV